MSHGHNKHFWLLGKTRQNQFQLVKIKVLTITNNKYKTSDVPFTFLSSVNVCPRSHLYKTLFVFCSKHVSVKFGHLYLYLTSCVKTLHTLNKWHGGQIGIRHPCWWQGGTVVKEVWRLDSHRWLQFSCFSWRTSLLKKLISSSSWLWVQNHVYPPLSVPTFLFYFEGVLCVYTHHTPSPFNYYDVLHLPLIYIPFSCFPSFSVTALFSSISVSSLLFTYVTRYVIQYFFETCFGFFMLCGILQFIAQRLDSLFGLQTSDMWVLSIFCWPEFPPVSLLSRFHRCDWNMCGAVLPTLPVETLYYILV